MSYEDYPLSVIFDEQIVQNFLKTAKVLDVSILEALQSSSLDENITRPTAYLSFALSFLEWLQGNPEPKQADIAVWVAHEFELHVLNRRVQALAAKLVTIVNK